MDDSKHELREMETYPGVLSSSIEPFKKEGVGFYEVGFDDGDI